tara:strand:- start:4337 stop:6661 length:2325 start_codon:yes stop_codon:yes gene_type:complete
MMMNKLPEFVEAYLEEGAPEGTRNETLFKAALQLRDMSWGESDIYACLERRGLLDGLPPSEIKASVRSALNRGRRNPPSKPTTKAKGYDGTEYRGRGGIRNYKLDNKPRGFTPGFINRGAEDVEKSAKEALEREYTLDEEERLPEDEIGDGCRAYLKAMFRAGEQIQLVRGDLDAESKERPSARGPLQATMSLERWLAKLDEHDGDAERALFPASAPHGIYVAINPLSDVRRVTANISAFRHALIEFDNIPTHHQWQLIQRSKIPCVAVIDSGGKSVHAIVKVDATDYSEYQQRVKLLVDHFRKYGVDGQNIDPTRLSRLPGVTRGDTGNKQRLLSLECGAESFTEWQASILYDHELPPEQSIDALLEFNRGDDPSNMIGKRWLCKGGSLIISGQSGIGKSSFLMQMALTWAQGEDLFGIKPIKPLKSLIVQAENDTGDLAEALQDICGGMDILENADTMEQIRENVNFFRDTVHTGERFVSIMARLIEKHRPDIVFVDPLLSFIGDDISQQAVASTFLRNMIGPVLAASGVIWVFLHHTGKPQKDATKNWNIKDMAYSGLGSSELANWARETISLQRASDEKDIYALALSKRGKRSGLTDEEGDPTNLIFLKHAENRILWERAKGFEPSDEGRGDGASTGSKRSGQGAGGSGYLGPDSKRRLESAFKSPQTGKAAAEIIGDTCDCSDRQARRYLREWSQGESPWLVTWKEGRSSKYQTKSARDNAAGESGETDKNDEGKGEDDGIIRPKSEDGWEELISDNGSESGTDTEDFF